MNQPSKDNPKPPETDKADKPVGPGSNGDKKTFKRRGVQKKG